MQRAVWRMRKGCGKACAYQYPDFAPKLCTTHRPGAVRQQVTLFIAENSAPAATLALPAPRFSIQRAERPEPALSEVEWASRAGSAPPAPASSSHACKFASSPRPCAPEDPAPSGYPSPAIPFIRLPGPLAPPNHKLHEPPPQNAGKSPKSAPGNARSASPAKAPAPNPPSPLDHASPPPRRNPPPSPFPPPSAHLPSAICNLPSSPLPPVSHFHFPLSTFPRAPPGRKTNPMPPQMPSNLHPCPSPFVHAKTPAHSPGKPPAPAPSNPSKK